MPVNKKIPLDEQFTRLGYVRKSTWHGWCACIRHIDHGTTSCDNQAILFVINDDDSSVRACANLAEVNRLRPCTQWQIFCYKVDVGKLNQGWVAGVLDIAYSHRCVWA